MTEVQAVLSPLVGLPLWACGRAADLLWLQMGRRVPFRSFLGGVAEKGEYILHIQCKWRIVDPSRNELIDDPEDENIDSGLLEFSASCLPLRIERIVVDEEHTLRLELEHNCTIEVFAANDEYEQWRFFQTAVDGSHWIFRNGVLEQDF